MPLEVNILDSNFDTQYTCLPIRINVAQEELIKINDPIVLSKDPRYRSKSFTFRPNLRQRKNRRPASASKRHHRQKRLHRETTIMAIVNEEKNMLSELRPIKHKQRSQHF